MSAAPRSSAPSGPATSSEEQIRALVERRHGRRPAEPQPRQPRRPRGGLPARCAGRPTTTGRGVGVLADLQGPKIRLGDFAAGPVGSRAGDEFTITTEDVPGDADQVLARPTTACPATCRPATGSSSTTARSRLEVIARRRPAGRDHASIEGGMISNHKGINLPGVAVSVPALSEKDDRRTCAGRCTCGPT